MAQDPEDLQREALVHFQLAVDPYLQRGHVVLALELGEFPKQPHASVTQRDNFLDFAEQLWGIAREVGTYWGPDRLETEALKRASDEAGPSVPAQEFQVLWLKYQEWLGVLHRWGKAIGYAERQGQHTFRDALELRAFLTETLGVVERKASVVEARALDLRLRVDHEKLLAALANREMASTLLEAIREATKDNASQAHLAKLAEKMDDLGGKVKDVPFVADWVTGQIGKELRAPASKATERLSKMVGTELVKKVLRLLIEQLGLPGG